MSFYIPSGKEGRRGSPGTKEQKFLTGQIIGAGREKHHPRRLLFGEMEYRNQFHYLRSSGRKAVDKFPQDI